MGSLTKEGWEERDTRLSFWEIVIGLLLSGMLLTAACVLGVGLLRLIQ